MDQAIELVVNGVKQTVQAEPQTSEAAPSAARHYSTKKWDGVPVQRLKSPT